MQSKFFTNIPARFAAVIFFGMIGILLGFGFFVSRGLAVLGTGNPALAIAAAGDPELQKNIEELNQTIKEKKAAMDSLSKEIEVYNQRISQTRQKAASIQNEVELLENKIKKVELDVERTEREMDTVNLEIRSLELQITDKTGRIEEQKAIIAEYLRTLYRYDNRSALEVLLSQNSFSEFFDQIRNLEQIEGNITETTQSLITLKAQLEEERKGKDAKKAVLAELEKRLQETRSTLGESREAKLVLAEDAVASETELKRSLQQIRNEQARIDSDLSAIENNLKEKLRENDRFTSLPQDTVLSWPVDPSRGITTYFHDPEYPFRYVFEHPGLDIRARQATPIRSSASGFVARARDAGMGYSYIMVLHPGGISTVYGHVSRILVADDQFVERGQIIGYSGGMPGTPGAGRLTTGPHLHFEVRSDGIPVNPLDYLLR